MKSYFVKNGSINIHVLENGVPSATTPSLVVLGGIWEPAERAIPVLSGISSHVIALSLRGRGLSSTPTNGYDLSDHLSDIATVVEHCKLNNYCVLGFSRGASYALGWSLKNQSNMSGLILVDQPPMHSAQNGEAVEYWSNFVYQGVPLLNFMRCEAIEGLSRDAVAVDFSSELSQLSLPVTFFVGKNKTASIPSNISDEVLEFYKQNIPKLEIIEFTESGHMIPDEEQQKYISEIALFIKKRS